ncbi:uncharacterized protein C2orf81 homolog [Sardina pilchardus]|uniref:uncharacterized protein C2orf81 homolog n=1 Tax=Sardina pilchardus TaxID=27697 RepID=UPI002E11E33E
MSRAASKSRADKGRGPATPAPPPAAHSQDVVDIVPGRLTQSFWLTMIAQEEGEEVVRDILDDFMTHVMEKCKEVYLKQQLIPFTVSRARDTLLEILEWQFLVQDAGEQSDSTWGEDAEPQPLLTDSWAQGCVSVTQRKPAPPQQPRTPVPGQQARRRSQNSTPGESQQKPSGSGKKQKDPKANTEAKPGPALGSQTPANKKGLPPLATTSINSQRNSLGPGSLFPPGQASGVPQPSRRSNIHLFSTSMPHHIDQSAGVEVNGPLRSFISPLKDNLPQPQVVEFRPNRSESPPSLKFLNQLLAGTSS